MILKTVKSSSETVLSQKYGPGTMVCKNKTQLLDVLSHTSRVEQTCCSRSSQVDMVPEGW